MTVASYKNDLEQFTTYCQREYALADLLDATQAIVRSWLANLIDEGYKVTSVHRKLSSVNAFFRFLLKCGLIRLNPARSIPKPRRPKRLPVFIDESGAKAIYELTERTLLSANNAFSHCRDLLIVTLLYETGIRQAELLGLKDSDVDEGLGQIKVLGKRNKMRYVPVGGEMVSRIKTYMELRDGLKLRPLSGYLLVTDNGKKISKSFVYLKVKSYLSQVTTVQKKSPHVLRHTFATHMLNNGADLNVIKEILGHSSLAATQVYTHNSIAKLKSIHSRMHPRNN